MRRIGPSALVVVGFLGLGFVLLGEVAPWHEARAERIAGLDARLVAINVPGASAISQVGAFLNIAPPAACANPIPTLFPSYIQSGAILDPRRLLVASRSNFGAPLATGAGRPGALLSIDPDGPDMLNVPPRFARSGLQASVLNGAVRLFSANSPHWLNRVNNPNANTAQYTGVSNPLGLSNNNAFGRIWPANAPTGETHSGSSSILDPTGLPLAGAPNAKIGGVYVDSLTNRDMVSNSPQIIAGSLSSGAIGTALLGPSPDGTCKAVFAVVTADGAVVQEHTLKGVDGLAPEGTVQSLQGRRWGPPYEDIPPRFGVVMNPYTQGRAARQLFVTEPFHNTVVVLNLIIAGAAPNQVFGLGSVRRLRSPALDQPVDLTPARRDTDNVNWASNTTLSDGSDFYVANRGNNTIVRMKQDGSVVAVRSVTVNGHALEWAHLNGIATSTDGTKIYVTFTSTFPGTLRGGVVKVSAFPSTN